MTPQRIGRFPGETSALSLIWAVLELASRGWRGITMTPKAVAQPDAQLGAQPRLDGVPQLDLEAHELGEERGQVGRGGPGRQRIARKLIPENLIPVNSRRLPIGDVTREGAGCLVPSPASSRMKSI